MPKNKPPLTPNFVGPTEAARIVGVSRSRLYQLLDSGEIPSRHSGRRRLISVADIEKWFSRLPRAQLRRRRKRRRSTQPRAPSEPPTGPLLSADQQQAAIERASELDLAVIYQERRKLLRRDVDDDEAHCRAYDFAVAAGCAAGLDLEQAKKIVRAAIDKGKEASTNA